MTKKKKNPFFTILGILFIIFISYIIAYNSGYYESNMARKSIMTEEKKKEFERDVKNNENIDIKDYLDNDYIDYSSKVSKVGNNLSNAINNLLEDGMGNVFKFLGELFT